MDTVGGYLWTAMFDSYSSERVSLTNVRYRFLSHMLNFMLPHFAIRSVLRVDSVRFTFYLIDLWLAQTSCGYDQPGNIGHADKN